MTDVNVETVYVEVIMRGQPAVVIHTAYTEVLRRGTPAVVVETAYVEAVITAGVDDTAFVGWGIPR